MPMCCRRRVVMFDVMRQRGTVPQRQNALLSAACGALSKFHTGRPRSTPAPSQRRQRDSVGRRKTREANAARGGDIAADADALRSMRCASEPRRLMRCTPRRAPCLMRSCLAHDYFAVVDAAENRFDYAMLSAAVSRPHRCLCPAMLRCAISPTRTNERCHDDSVC